MITRPTRLNAFLIVLALAALLHGDKPKTQVRLDADKLKAVPEVMARFIADKKAAGVVMLVASRSELVQVTALGKADIEADRAMEKDTMFWIASMTKPITGAALMILHDEKRLSLDDPVSKYIPAFKDVKLNGEKPSREITLRDLATHTSGIGEAAQSQSVAGGSLKEIAEKIAAQPLKYQPGEKWSYGSGLTVIGRVIEVVSGKSYEEFVQTRILDPLEMKDTTFHLSADQMKRIAHSYEPDKEKAGLVRVNNPYAVEDAEKKQTPNPSGGLFSTAADLARFYQMVLNEGQFNGKRIMSGQAVDEMTNLAHDGKIVTGFTPGNGWGIGWCVVREPQGATAALTPGSAGHGGAHGTQSWMDPNRGLVYIMLVQRTGFGNGDDSDMRRAFQDTVAKAIK
jgi:CubicO group peptidase (beta-lactamase class C family)